MFDILVSEVSVDVMIVLLCLLILGFLLYLSFETDSLAIGKRHARQLLAKGYSLDKVEKIANETTEKDPKFALGMLDEVKYRRHAVHSVLANSFMLFHLKRQVQGKQQR